MSRTTAGTHATYATHADSSSTGIRILHKNSVSKRTGCRYEFLADVVRVTQRLTVDQRQSFLGEPKIPGSRLRCSHSVLYW